MAYAELVNGRIDLTIAAGEKLQVRDVPGRLYDLQKQNWYVPLSWASCIALRGVFGDGLHVGPELTAWATSELKSRVQPSLYLRGLLELPPEFFDSPDTFDDDEYAGLEGLYPFQQVGAEFLVTAKQALLADEMGTGKTIQVIGALKLVKPRRTLVVCPNSVKRNWLREITKWWPEAYAVVYSPGKKGKDAIELVASDIDQSQVLIVNWENTWRLSKLAPFGHVKMSDKDKEPKILNSIDFDVVVADEAHRAKEPTAKQTRALWAIAWKADYRWALTGTPVANSPRDLWSIMHGLAPHEYQGYTQFVDRYGLKSWNGFGGLEVVGLNPATREEFFKFFDARFLRRPKSLVLPDLPPKTYIQRVCTLPAKQKKAYKEIEKRMLTELDNGDLAYVTNPLAKLTRLRQLAASYVDVTDGKWTMTEPSGVLDELDQVLEEAGTEQVVVFAEYSQLIDLYAARLEKRGIEFGLITGSQSDQLRQDDIDRFREGKIRIMLGTLGAGGEGVDGLQVASTVVFIQRAYSLIKDKQAEDRLHRDGQKFPVEVIDIYPEDTIIDRIFEAIGTKTERLEEICRDEETLRELIAG